MQAEDSMRPVFVVGLGRSGTTLLRLMLNAHPRIAIPYEGHFIPSYARRIGEYGDLEREDNLRRLLSDLLAEEKVREWDHEFEIDRVAERVRAPTLAGALHALYEDYAEGKGKPRWGDKSSYIDEIPIINDLFPTAQFIHIVRDGRDVVTSVLKQPWGPRDVIEGAAWWNDNTWVACRMGSILGPARYAEVRFEDLVSDPEKELKRLSRFLGEDFDPSMLEYHRSAEDRVPDGSSSLHYNVNRAPMASRAGAWKETMHPGDVAVFSRQAHRMLGELGYEVPDPPAGGLAVGWRMFRVALHRVVRGL